jgi:acyl transferase domain-containing protein
MLLTVSVVQHSFAKTTTTQSSLFSSLSYSPLLTSALCIYPFVRRSHFQINFTHFVAKTMFQPPRIRAPSSLKQSGTLLPEQTHSTTKQKLVTEISRYENLKKTAEQLMKQTVSHQAEVDIMATKLAQQEKLIQSQTIHIQKLREDKAKLHTVLQTEKQLFEKLKFDMTALHTMCTSLKTEVMNFQTKITEVENDKRELEKSYRSNQEHSRSLETQLKNLEEWKIQATKDLQNCIAFSLISVF